MGSEKEPTPFEKAMVDGLSNLTVEVRELRTQMNGRVKKLEHTVFGNEENDKIGLAEKTRRLESGWAKLTLGATLIVSVVFEGIKFGGHLLLDALSRGQKPHP